MPEGLESIGDLAFSGCDALTTVTFPDSLTTISEGAFVSCDNLKTVNIGSGLSSLNEMTFLSCTNIESYTVSEENQSFCSEDGVLYNKSKTELVAFPPVRTGSFTIPDGVYSLGVFTFSNSQFETLVFSKQLNDIGGYYWRYDVGGLTFNNADDLTSFVVPEENEYYSAVDGILLNKEKTEIVRCPCGKSGKVVIPDGVSSIGYRAFLGCEKLTQVVFADSVDSIYKGGFNGCENLESITLNSGLTSIYENAFLNCKSLKKLDIPRTVYTLDLSALSGCESLEAVNIEEFSECRYTSVDGMVLDSDGKTLCFCPLAKKGDIVIPDGVETIQAETFQGNKAVTSVTMPDSVRSVGEYCFADCDSLERVVLSKNITEMGKYVFHRCKNLKSVVIPEGITQLPEYMFSYCTSLENVEIPYGVTYLPDMFSANISESEASSLKTVTVPDSVTEIYDSFIPSALRDSVTIKGYSNSEAQWYAEHNDIKFESIGDIDKETEFTDGDFSYKNLTSRTVRLTDWNGSGDKIVLPETVGGKTVTDFSSGLVDYEDRDKITSITLPNTITELDLSELSDYDGLTELNIPAGVTKIDDFYESVDSLLNFNVDENNETYCSVDGVLFSKDRKTLIRFPGGRSGEYTVPDGTEDISSDAFSCAKIESVIMPDSVIGIGSDAFEYCEELKNVKISAGVVTLAGSVFRGCTSLSEIVIPSNVLNINSLAFWDCSALSKVTLSEGVRNIGYGAFNGCTALTSVDLPSTAESVDVGAFSGCDALENINCSSDNDVYCSVDGVLFTKDKSAIVIVPKAKKGEFAVPDGVTGIQEAFRGCSGITSVVLPSSLAEIGSYAFSGCESLTDITIPESVVSIGTGAFEECSGLKNVVIPDGVDCIRTSTFEYCSSLETVSIPESVTVIEDHAFENCYALT